MKKFAREMLFGKWYRTDTDEQSQQQTEYAELSEDGSFEFSFTTHTADGEVASQVIEFGDWGLVGDIHFTITKSELVGDEHYVADLTHEDNYQAYQVLQLTPLIFEYQHIISKEVFTLRRINNVVGNA
ncbi:hypothetical protein HR060_06435 [Catenovulum sp. SM1970]|uniref:hypothetical protein n=1 Tax=Marinifaba aquimaris TaxID=2741323 RepID=UPI0015721F1E|nr:hypothetical protein [Marinifaba aquimaris]NTS76504.1 hypothetical protein [Marinifaba aquimaris]